MVYQNCGTPSGGEHFATSSLSRGVNVHGLVFSRMVLSRFQGVRHLPVRVQTYFGKEKDWAKNRQ